MTSKKTQKQNFFNKKFLTLLIVILVVEAVIIVFKHAMVSTQGISNNNSTVISHHSNNINFTIAPTLASWNVSTVRWNFYTLPNEKLSFMYPKNWSVTKIQGQTQDYDSVEVRNGRYLINFLVYKSNSYEAGHSMAGSLNDWVPIDSFILNNQTVYLLNEGGNGNNGSGGITLSSCASNTKCLVKAKNVPGYIDILSSYVEGTGGDVAPGTIQANDPNLGIIKAIIKSITYN